MTAGRPTELDDEMLLKIKGYVLDGKDMKQISEILDIPYKTMESWKSRNYQGFSDKMLSFKLERMFEKSITEIEVLQGSQDERVKLQANTLVAKGIGKKYFSERVEQTGADGKELRPITINYIKPNESKDDTQE